jgi:hypothetical protein
MENERASNNPKRNRDGDELFAVYAPPRHAHEPAGRAESSVVWSARAMLAAAFRDQRRTPLRALLLLGLLPGLWCLPADLLLREFSSEELSLQWGIQVREAAYNLLHSLWTAVPVGGQTLISLDIARAHTVTPRRFLEGLRFAPAIFVVGAFSILLLQVMLAPAGAGSEELSPRDLLISLAIMLLMIVPVMSACFVYALVSYPLVDRRRGLFDALRQVWEISKKSFWRYVRLSVLTGVLITPGIVLSVAESTLVASAVFALFVPTVQLAWAHAYLRSSEGLE